MLRLTTRRTLPVSSMPLAPSALARVPQHGPLLHACLRLHGTLACMRLATGVPATANAPSCPFPNIARAPSPGTATTAGAAPGIEAGSGDSSLTAVGGDSGSDSGSN